MATNPFGTIDTTGLSASGLTSRAPISVPQTGGFSPATSIASPTASVARAPAPATSAFAPVPVASSPALAPPKPAPTPASQPLVSPNVSQPTGVDPINNPGYTSQALQATQNQVANDPYAGAFQGAISSAQTPSAGEQYLSSNLGNLTGAGNGTQYWNQVQGQFNQPFAGEQYTQQAAQAFSPSGPASSFYNQNVGNQGAFTNYSGPQASSQVLGQNMASGPLGAQQFYNSVAGSYPSLGQYGGPNLSASQYSTTQSALGNPLPSTTSADPYYDRAIQLGTQSYNQNAASRGVYGSSEALSGVGNVISNLNAQRAQNAFQNEMSVDQEERMRQQLLGQQAQAADQSSLAAFGANLSGLQTFGGLANNAGNQTLGQQTMFGNQAANVDQAAQSAQNSNIAGLSAFGQLAQSADQSQTNRFNATTGAMNNADQTAINRLSTGGNLANQADQTAIQGFNAQNNAATNAGNLANARTNTQISGASSGSAADISRFNTLFNATASADNALGNSVSNMISANTNAQNIIQNMMASGQAQTLAQNESAFDDFFNAQLAPVLQQQGLDQQKLSATRDAMFKAFQSFYSKATS